MLSAAKIKNNQILENKETNADFNLAFAQEFFKNFPQMTKLHRNIRYNSQDQNKRFNAFEWFQQHLSNTDPLIGLTETDSKIQDNAVYQFLLTASNKQTSLYSSFSKHPITGDIRPYSKLLGKGGFGRVKETSHHEVMKIINITKVIQSELKRGAQSGKEIDNAMHEKIAKYYYDLVASEIIILSDLGKLLRKPYSLINHKGEEKICLILNNEGQDLKAKIAHESEQEASLEAIDPEELNKIKDRELQRAIGAFMPIDELNSNEASLSLTQIAHFDPKIENYTEDDDGHMHLIDYGLSDTDPQQIHTVIHGTPDSLSPVLLKGIRAVDYDLISTARTCHYTVATDYINKYNGKHITKTHTENKLPKFILNHLDPIVDKKIIELLDTANLTKHYDGRIFNQYGPIPQDALEYAAKLALLRRNRRENLTQLDNASETKKRAIVALSFSGIDKSDPVWDKVLNPKENSIFLQSIVILNKFDQELLENKTWLNKNTCITDTVEKLYSKITSATGEQLNSYQAIANNENNPNFLKRCVIALSLKKIPCTHPIWQHAVIENNRLIQKILVENLDVNKPGIEQSALIKILLVAALKHLLEDSPLAATDRKRNYAKNLLLILDDPKNLNLEQATTYLKQSARILSHQPRSEKSDLFFSRKVDGYAKSYTIVEPIFEAARALADINDAQWKAVLTHMWPGQNIDTYAKHFKNNPGMFKATHTHSEQDTAKQETPQIWHEAKNRVATY